jgi:hypothetical protein
MNEVRYGLTKGQEAEETVERGEVWRKEVRRKEEGLECAREQSCKSARVP